MEAEGVRGEPEAELVARFWAALVDRPFDRFRQVGRNERRRPELGGIGAGDVDFFAIADLLFRAGADPVGGAGRDLHALGQGDAGFAHRGGGAFLFSQVLGEDQLGLQAGGGSRHLARRFGFEGRGEGEPGAVRDRGQQGRGGEELARLLVAIRFQPQRHFLAGGGIGEEGLPIGRFDAARSPRSGDFAGCGAFALPGFVGSQSFFIVSIAACLAPKRRRCPHHNTKSWRVLDGSGNTVIARRADLDIDEHWIDESDEAEAGHFLFRMRRGEVVDRLECCLVERSSHFHLGDPHLGGGRTFCEGGVGELTDAARLRCSRISQQAGR